MADWLVALTVGVVAAIVQYARLRAPSFPKRAGLAAIRALAIALTLALLLNAPLGRARPVPPSVFVDASASMTRGGDLMKAAWDSARSIGADSTWAFGDSVRPAPSGATGSSTGDAESRVRAVVERSLASGAPAIVITDGELRDSSALEGLAGGSRLIVIPRPDHRDAAIAAMDAPRAAVDGDSIGVRLTFSAAAGGAAAGQVTILLGAQTLGRWPLAEMSPWSERQLEVRARVGAPQGAAVLRAIVSSAGDAEPRNDTLAAAIEVSRAASAVFVSTSPDQDSRFALAVLRGALALPTRGFLRVAPGAWRHEGALTAATETEVREALREAPVAILHGDTSIFGPPTAATVGPLALLVPSQADDGEWYPSATPASPLTSALSSLPLDSLAPLSAGAPATGDWTALEVRRGRESTRRAIVTGTDAPRRIVRITGSGFWRWRFRGGASADAYSALMGGVFDWLAAERADRRGAVPDENVLRAGQPIRWRRGSSGDSIVPVVLTVRGRATDTVSLRFAPGVSLQETPPLAAGVYEVTVPGGRTLLVVNQSAELLPTRPLVRSGDVGGRARPDDARGARYAPWLYALVILLLCAEWFLRRRAGLR
ncbi:MAG TPA: hypothetical protein VFO66_13735 [Gemmatimonadaceae bacterium]|nr:hypothetical protein [Gemmatimonadaceae bacterium]